jgi:hypothetical protein
MMDDVLDPAEQRAIRTEMILSIAVREKFGVEMGIRLKFDETIGMVSEMHALYMFTDDQVPRMHELKEQITEYVSTVIADCIQSATKSMLTETFKRVMEYRCMHEGWAPESCAEQIYTWIDNGMPMEEAMERIYSLAFEGQPSRAEMN